MQPTCGGRDSSSPACCACTACIGSCGGAIQPPGCTWRAMRARGGGAARRGLSWVLHLLLFGRHSFCCINAASRAPRCCPRCCGSVSRRRSCQCPTLRNTQRLGSGAPFAGFGVAGALFFGEGCSGLLRCRAAATHTPAHRRQRGVHRCISGAATALFAGDASRCLETDGGRQNAAATSVPAPRRVAARGASQSARSALAALVARQCRALSPARRTPARAAPRPPPTLLSATGGARWETLSGAPCLPISRGGRASRWAARARRARRVRARTRNHLRRSCWSASLPAPRRWRRIARSAARRPPARARASAARPAGRSLPRRAPPAAAPSGQLMRFRRRSSPPSPRAPTTPRC